MKDHEIFELGDVVFKTSGIDGPYEEALGRIRAKAIVMPAEKDLYFSPRTKSTQ